MRILLADHHSTVLNALLTRLQEEASFTVIGAVSNAESLMDLASELHPDLVLLEWELPGGDRQGLINFLHQLEPRPLVIVMSSKLEKGRAALAAGADAFASKWEDSTWLIEALQVLKFQPPKAKT